MVSEPPEQVKLLQLTATDLRTGVARSQHENKGAVWQSAIGLNPFLEDDTSRFLLCTTAAPTRRATSQITDMPIAQCSLNGFMYILGSTGRLVAINYSNTASVIIPQTTLVLGTILNPTGGMIPITDSGGNSYVFIAARQDRRFSKLR